MKFVNEICEWNSQSYKVIDLSKVLRKWVWYELVNKTYEWNLQIYKVIDLWKALRKWAWYELVNETYEWNSQSYKVIYLSKAMCEWVWYELSVKCKFSHQIPIARFQWQHSPSFSKVLAKPLHSSIYHNREVTFWNVLLPYSMTEISSVNVLFVPPREQTSLKQ